MNLTREDRKVIAAAVASDPELAAARDLFTALFQIFTNGRDLDPDIAAAMLYEFGIWLSQIEGVESVILAENGRSTVKIGKRSKRSLTPN